MAKHQKNTRGLSMGDRKLVEHSETMDDSLLPSAEEIQKLIVMDANILEWLKERTAKEQDFRHAFYNQQIGHFDKVNTRHHTTSRLALLVFFLLIGGMAASSYFLISIGKETGGYLAGFGSIIFSVSLLVSGIYNRKMPTRTTES